MPTISVRGSSLPTLARCSAQLTLEGVRIDSDNDAALLGTVVHEACGWVVQGKSDWRRRLKTLASATGLDHKTAEEAEILTAVFAQGWDEQFAAEHHEHPSLEPHLTAVFDENGDDPDSLTVTLSGHIDILTVFPNLGTAVIDDIKTSREERDYWDQGHGYAALVFANHIHVQTVTVRFIFLRDGTTETMTVSRADSHLWVERVLFGTIMADRDTFKPGKACTYCPAKAECPGRSGFIRSTTEALVSEPSLASKVLAALNSDEPRTAELGAAVQDTLARCKVIKAAIDDFEKSVRANIEELGPLPIGDDKELAITQTERRVLDAEKAWPVMQEFLDDDQIATVVDIPVSKLEDRVAEYRPEGAKKKHIIDELNAQLAAAGAVSKVPFQRKLTTRKIEVAANDG